MNPYYLALECIVNKLKRHHTIVCQAIGDKCLFWSFDQRPRYLASLLLKFWDVNMLNIVKEPFLSPQRPGGWGIRSEIVTK